MQCNALWRPYKRNPMGFYCVLEAGHKGPHQAVDGRTFTEAQNVAPFEKKLRASWRHC